MNLNKKKIKLNFFNTPKGIRIPVASVKGKCPRPLDDGGKLQILKLIVGITGFEPVTFCSQSRRATKLRYIPTMQIIVIYKINICLYFTYFLQLTYLSHN